LLFNVQKFDFLIKAEAYGSLFGVGALPVFAIYLYVYVIGG
jgi:hypothetical protein